MSTETYWSCLTAHSEFQLGRGSPCCRDNSAGYVAICPVFFPCFWLSESSQFCTLSDIFYPWNRAVALLSGRKPTLFLLTQPLSLSEDRNRGRENSRALSRALLDPCLAKGAQCRELSGLHLCPVEVGGHEDSSCVGAGARAVVPELCRAGRTPLPSLSGCADGSGHADRPGEER